MVKPFYLQKVMRQLNRGLASQRDRNQNIRIFILKFIGVDQADVHFLPRSIKQPALKQVQNNLSEPLCDEFARYKYFEPKKMTEVYLERHNDILFAKL